MYLISKMMIFFIYFPQKSIFFLKMFCGKSRQKSGGRCNYVLWSLLAFGTISMHMQTLWLTCQGIFCFSFGQSVWSNTLKMQPYCIELTVHHVSASKGALVDKRKIEELWKTGSMKNLPSWKTW